MLKPVYYVYNSIYIYLVFTPRNGQQHKINFIRIRVQVIKKEDILAALAYQKEIGVETVLSEMSHNRFEEVQDTSLDKKEGKKERLSMAQKSSRHEKNIQNQELVELACQQAMQCNTLDELRQAVADFEGGKNLQSTAKNLVFSDGNFNARIMLIGEAPGRDEDIQGLPFVGRSGQLLEKILHSIGIDRQNKEPDKSIYISNILPWRPPANRTPTDAEARMFLPFVERHVFLIKPEILVFAGGTSAKIMLGTKTGIKSLRGKWHNWSIKNEVCGQYSCLARPTLHPAYLLRNPIDKRLVWEDMLMIKEKRREYL